MNITELITKMGKPVLYEKGTAFMWTDEHISKQLLNIHLNPDIDLGSRKKATIQKTANWILETLGKKNATILDLGCGPGLYAEIFAQKGHKVTGVDISENSINYACNNAETKGLDIDYINASYLDIEPEENKYDLVTLIYTDFGVLLPEERKRLLSIINKSLKPGGLFIFDVLNDKNLYKKTAPKNWEAAGTGFWKSTPYIALSESYLYDMEKVILYQHFVIDDKSNCDIYRFWTHFFSHQDLETILAQQNFELESCHENILPCDDLFSGDNVTFSVASKLR